MHQELQPDIRALIKIALPSCIKTLKVGLLFWGQLINEHNMLIRVDRDAEIGGPESAIFCDTIGLQHGLYIVSDKKISDETGAHTI